MAKYQKGKYGSITNQHGVRITKGERAKIKSMVAANNRLHAKLSSEAQKWSDIPKGLLWTERELPFVPVKASTDLSKIKTQAQLQRFIKRLTKNTDGKFLDRTARIYKKSISTALENVGVSTAVQQVFRKLTTAQMRKFVNLLGGDNVLDYLYNSQEEDDEREQHIIDMLEEVGANVKGLSWLR